MISSTDQLIILSRARLVIRILRTVNQLIILSIEDLIIYIDSELDVFIARIQFISYCYILL